MSEKQLTWQEVATVLGSRMRHHAYCPDHGRNEAEPDHCPFCADRAAYDFYVAKTRRARGA